MKSRSVTLAILPTICLFSLSTGVLAQHGSVSFNNKGISVVFRILASSPNSSKQTFGGVFFTGQDEKEKTSRVHRVLADRANGAYFGYDVVIKSASQPGKFKVSVEPLSIKPPDTMGLSDLTSISLPKYPEDLIVADGDSIAIDVLVNPQTKVNIVDYIKITTKKPLGPDTTPIDVSETGAAGGSNSGMSGKQKTRDFTPNDVKLRLTSPSLLADGAISPLLGGQWEGIIEGTFLNIYIPGKGRVFFSLFPHQNPKFGKTAVVENNKIRFQVGDASYELVSEAPVVPGGGSWNLWMLHDADYRPDLSFSVEAAGHIEYGASNDVESVVKQEWRKSRLLPIRPPKVSEAVYQRWFDEVRYTMTDEENQAFAGLKTNEEREQFISAFWKRRDPTPETDRNEFREEYYSRLAFANQNFAFSSTPGYMTDRGRIFVMNGRPAEIQKTGSGEIWIYGNKSKYEFVEAAKSGDLRLKQ